MNKLITIFNKYLFVRYLFSGGFSSAIDILLFSFFIEYFGLHYIISASISITVSFTVRFYLQKVFTFKDRNLDIHRQIIMYSVLYILSLVVAGLLLYLLIDILHIWYVFAQIIAIGITAIISFFVYRHIIFKKVDPHTPQKI